MSKMNNSAWKRAKKTVGVQQVRVHDLKHTFGRRLRAARVLVKYGAPGEIRTPDPLVRSQILYPTELRAQYFSLLSNPLYRILIPPFTNFFISLVRSRMAEREGFEPSMELPPYSLSRGAPSAARPSLRENL